MPKTVLNDVTGMKFGRLTALKFIPDDTKFSKFLCRCDCGTEKIINAQSFTRGFTVSCGCYQKEKLNIRSTHGHSGASRSKTYNSWAGMMDRCEWGGHPSFKQYGAAGIKVDPHWHVFENFLADMGPRPAGTSIDRTDNKKGYFPGNCRWATRLEQALNTSRTIKLIYNRDRIPFHVLCEQLGLSKKAVRAKAQRRGGDYVAALNSIGVIVEKDES